MLHITLNDTQVAELRQLARQAVGRVSERAHFVLLSHQGNSPPEIGRLMGYDAATVRTWLKAYQTRQCAGLDDAPRSGRPAQEPDLVAIVQAQTSQSPPTMGYLQTCWTVALLVLHLCQRLRIQVSPATVRRAWHGSDPSWPPLVGPTHTPPKNKRNWPKYLAIPKGRSLRRMSPRSICWRWCARCGNASVNKSVSPPRARMPSGACSVA